MNRKYTLLSFICLLLIGMGCYYYLTGKPAFKGHKVVVCIPVYGQSLALGEEAIRVTDFDDLKNDFGGRILTENLDYRFGYFDHDNMKKAFKKLIRYQKRSFELTVYGMAESLAKELGNDTLICIFPGGQGTTMLADMSKGSAAYEHFIADLKTAYDNAQQRGWDFYVPAICWMQGESDIAEYPKTNYQELLKKFYTDVNQDVKSITHQKTDTKFISYQTNAVSRAKKFNALAYICEESKVPEAQMELVRDDTLFWASGPTYQYSFAREAIHIDGISQKRHGYLVAESALKIIRGGSRFQGLVPTGYDVDNNNLAIHFNVPFPPLVIDTILVKKANNYGFDVITPDNESIVSAVSLENDTIIIRCKQSPIGCKIRYAINGEPMKSGFEKGPRGNLRDSKEAIETPVIAGKQYPAYNWCFQFDFVCTPNK